MEKLDSSIKDSVSQPVLGKKGLREIGTAQGLPMISPSDKRIVGSTELEVFIFVIWIKKERL